MATDKDWAKTVKLPKKGPQCSVCLDPGAKRLKLLINTVIKNNYMHITMSMIYSRMCQLVKGFEERVTYSTLQRHLRLGHEPGWREHYERRQGRS